MKDFYFMWNKKQIQMHEESIQCCLVLGLAVATTGGDRKLNDSTTVMGWDKRSTGIMWQTTAAHQKLPPDKTMPSWWFVKFSICLDLPSPCIWKNSCLTGRLLGQWVWKSASRWPSKGCPRAFDLPPPLGNHAHLDGSPPAIHSPSQWLFSKNY